MSETKLGINWAESESLWRLRCFCTVEIADHQGLFTHPEHGRFMSSALVI